MIISIERPFLLDRLSNSYCLVYKHKHKHNLFAISRAFVFRMQILWRNTLSLFLKHFILMTSSQRKVEFLQCVPVQCLTKKRSSKNEFWIRTHFILNPKTNYLGQGKWFLELTIVMYSKWSEAKKCVREFNWRNSSRWNASMTSFVR